jgi:hypothetical protein
VISTDLDSGRLLEQALERVRRLREVRETIALNETSAAEVERCLTTAQAAMAKLWQPEACYKQIEFRPIDGGVMIDDTLAIREERLAKRYTKDSLLFVYNHSLGYDSRHMMDEFEGDYALYHFHYYIGRTLLLLIGREFYDQATAQFPQLRLFRFPIPLPVESEQQRAMKRMHYWDPDKIARILPLLKGSRTNLAVTEAGCISPMFTIVGVMLGTPVMQHGDVR